MTTDLVALGFQGVVTIALAIVHFGLWRQQRHAYHLSWAWAWVLYASRLLLISAFLLDRDLAWLFLHQAVTGLSALLLLFAALQFARGTPWRPQYLWVGVATVGWAAFTVLGIRDMAVGGISATVILSAVTFVTAGVFWWQSRRMPGIGVRVLAWAFTLWGLHHLDYPILRAQGSGVLYGVFLDVIFLLCVAVGTLTMVLGQERRALEQRTEQLEQLTQLLLRAQEEERRRIARELHDEAGQALTALKIELDLEGRKRESGMVANVLELVRNVTHQLRPRALDDLGLATALRALADDMAARTRITITFEGDDAQRWPADVAMVLYRVAQEALTNVARHSGASSARVRLARAGESAELTVEDDGRGFGRHVKPHLGLLGMRERVTALGGELALEAGASGGVRVHARVPLAEAAS
jgi:signal transduction histidine kinase